MRPSPWDSVEWLTHSAPIQWDREAHRAQVVSCRRCSGGYGMLCDACALEVVVAALDTVRETSWPEPPEIETPE